DHVSHSRWIIFYINSIPKALNRNIKQLELFTEKYDNLKETMQQLKPVVDLNDEHIDSFQK
ncbi:hypothetical protein, partial [Erwinia amylovora]|uniref:hypothetical protein n=1 Tax=Erwinia amylovora TaxID=552 RepID=UPI0020BF98BC